MTTKVVQHKEVQFTYQDLLRYLYSFKRTVFFVLVVWTLTTVKLMLKEERNRGISILSKRLDPTNLTRPGDFSKYAVQFPETLRDSWEISAKHKAVDQDEGFSSMNDPGQSSMEVTKHFVDLIKHRFTELKGITENYKLKSDEGFTDNIKISDDPDVFTKSIDKLLDTQNNEIPKQTMFKFMKNGLVKEAIIYGEDIPMELTKNWTESTTEEIREVMKQRSAVVESVCQHYTASNNFTERRLDRLYGRLKWVTEYNFIWCPLFKCASTTWTRNLGTLTHIKGPNRSPQLFPPPTEKIVRRTLLQTAKKMLLVRHPLDRLLSAYRDKMLRVNLAGMYEDIQRQISETYEEPFVPSHINLSAIKPPAPYQPSFNQFLLRVKDDLTTYWQNKRPPVNAHWSPYWATCSPCSMHYDIIAKVETLKRDQEFVVRDRGFPASKFFAKTHSSVFDGFNSSAAATTAYYSRVPRSLLTEIVKLYQPDFDLFEYSPEFYLQLSVPDV